MKIGKSVRDLAKRFGPGKTWKTENSCPGGVRAIHIHNTSKDTRKDISFYTRIQIPCGKSGL